MKSANPGRLAAPAIMIIGGTGLAAAWPSAKAGRPLSRPRL